MNSVRAKYTRGEEVKYISHLDLMRVFERAIRRAGIPIAYSQGYNPHPQMVFALPLSVGVTSEVEYVDFSFESEVSPSVLIKRLNQQLPNGIRLVEAREKNTKENIMATICSAKYNIYAVFKKEIALEDLRKNVVDFLDSESIIIKKKTKKDSKDIDIKPMIYDIKTFHLGSEMEYRDIFCFSVSLAAGSVENLKPELLIEALGEFLGHKIEPIKVHRIGLLLKKDNNAIEPLSKEALRVK